MSVSRRIKLFFTIIFLLGLTVFYPFIVYKYQLSCDRAANSVDFHGDGNHDASVAGNCFFSREYGD